METRCLIHRWTLFSVAFVVLAATTTTVVTATTGAQSNASSQAKPTSPTTPAFQEPVPPDHYDPDDTKTWPDVVTEDVSISIRQRQFTIHFYRPRSSSAVLPAIYACGDGGWRGLAPRTAQELAHTGFVVAGIDSKVYLKDFSSIEKPLTTKQLARDYVDVAKALRAYANLDSGTPVYIYGWSLGAGFAIAVGADFETRSNWAGIISIGPSDCRLPGAQASSTAIILGRLSSSVGCWMRARRAACLCSAERTRAESIVRFKLSRPFGRSSIHPSVEAPRFGS